MGTRFVSVLILFVCAASDAATQRVGCQNCRFQNLDRRASQASTQRIPPPDALRPRTTIVVDIDETLCVTDYNSVLWGIGSDDSRPLPNAAAALSRLAQDFEIIYLTARPKTAEGKTRRWLSAHGFPSGRIITSPTLADFVAQTGFKKNTLARLQRQSGRLLIGIGDKPTDADAYRRSGMLPVVVNPWKTRRYRADDLIFQDWTAVEAFFTRNRDLLTDSPRLTQALRERNVPLVSG